MRHRLFVDLGEEILAWGLNAAPSTFFTGVSTANMDVLNEK